jgi:hypothetical protein
MSCAINCDEVELTHTSEDLVCNGVKAAGASSIVLFWCLDGISDITDPSQIQAAIAQNEALLVESIKFGNDLPTPTTGPKPTSCGTPSVLYVTQSLTITDYSYNQDNNELYQELGHGRKVAAILAWDCNTNPNFPDTSRYYVPSGSGGITFAGGLSDADDDDEAAFFQVTGTYKGRITIIPTPAGIFA